MNGDVFGLKRNSNRDGTSHSLTHYSPDTAPRRCDANVVLITMMVNQRVEEHVIIEEGQRKKKKRKKQVLVPRPACSWVYLSKEFIKEYIATHSESPGLRAMSIFFDFGTARFTTKAASNAWKSLNLKEKEKYDRHAREVWDAYLCSGAAAPDPKPGKQTKLVTRCSPGRLFNVLQRLTPKQKESVWALAASLASDVELFVTVDIEIVLGLSASGKEVVNSGPEDMISDFRSSYNPINRRISVRLLEERLATAEAGDDFKRSFVLYVLETLLSPTARLDVMLDPT
ncbi:unnamed protein product [Sphenostylis stenocarpa]|uniref:Uncharacterized protein n=1 Tax=Sphenostylis stenocarpa TaxID=92480 RepID=A0AA86W1G6_9FABA|nr:unnamed protein product [Sphenostylis stenocarpa]